MAKARTVAAKRKAKRGRPMIEGVAREPNGRISRSGIDHGPADVVALEARMRHTGLPADKAIDQKAATFIGYLSLIGARDGLSEIQYQAAVAFRDLYHQYQRAMKSPGAQYDPRAIGGDGIDPDAYAEWVKSTKDKFDKAREAVMEAQFGNKSENILAAADYVLMRDQPLHHLVGATRILCNNLVRHFKIGQKLRNSA